MDTAKVEGAAGKTEEKEGAKKVKKSPKPLPPEEEPQTSTP